MRLFEYIAQRLGYVHQQDVDAQITAIVAAKDEVEKTLREKTRTLEYQLMMRDRLENEVGYLRDLQLAHARNSAGVCNAVARMDLITGKLREMMQSVWPDAVLLDDGSDFELPAYVTTADQPVARTETCTV